MLPSLSQRTISLFAIVLSGVNARAIDTNIASIPTANVSSLIISDVTNVTESSQRCICIDSCRTLNDIIQSCLVTILACVWFAVHRNIPAPKPKPPQHPNIVVRTAQRAWSVVLDQRESAIVFVVALLAPEWILAWALRQAITARRLSRKLEEARSKAIEAQNGRPSSAVSHSERDAEEVAGSSSSFDRSAASHSDDEHIQLINRHPSARRVVDKCEKCAATGSQCDLFAAAQNIAKADKGWGMSHAFLVTMGGFQFYDGNGPLHPLSPENILELVGRGHLVPPTAEEISNQSKGDALSKGVAILQTLWFILQCIARRVEHLPVTTLEVMTLAYTVMTVAMYIAWWDKPLNITCAVRVPVEEVEDEELEESDSIWVRIFGYVIGWQADSVDLRQCKRVPTFWAGNADKDDAMIADLISLLVAMVFGAMHCIAWDSKFQTPLELQLWRSSAIAIIVVPVALVVAFFVTVMVAGASNSDGSAMVILTGILYTLIGIIYVVARLILIFLSFASLRDLPFGAYQTVQWTAFIPHI